MANPDPRWEKTPATAGIHVHNPATGGMVEVRGYGALEGQLTIAKGIDLTRPIYDQVKRKSGSAAPKRP